MLWELGCRDSRIVSRSAPELNMSPALDPTSRMLSGAERMAAWRPFRLGLDPSVGDIVLCGSVQRGEKRRMCVFLSSDGNEWTMATAGVMDKFGLQCAEVLIVELRGETLRWHDGPSRVNGWVDIDKVDY
jgi:hypothetical protein